MTHSKDRDEASTEEEIPAVTYREVLSPEDDGNVAHEKFKIVPLFICDIHRSEVTNNYDLPFKFSNIDYQFVKICGTIRGVSVRLNHYVYTIDDGTDIIGCFVYKYDNDLENDIEDCYKKQVEEKNAAYSETEDEAVRDLLLININIMQKCKDKYKMFLPYDRFEIGDFVTVFGKVKDLSEERVIFAKRIKRDACEDVEKETEIIDEIINYYMWHHFIDK